MDAVARATAAVFVAGRHAGSAVLVDRFRLLTAGHVVRQYADGRLADRVELVFPLGGADASSDHDHARRWTAHCVSIDGMGRQLDLCVLDIDADASHSSSLPLPAPLWPARTLPRQVRTFGYPQQESALRGVWRDFTVSGPAADGLMQLDWAGPVGTLPGHSGGPVVDAATGQVLGILVEGSHAGHFDRFLGLPAILAAFPELPRPWMFCGVDARSHFERRARGHRGQAESDDLFAGRARAVSTVRDWLTRRDAPVRALVITGQPGAGKSAVLARAVLQLEEDRTPAGVAFHARGASHQDLLDALAAKAGLGHVEQSGMLLDLLAAAPPDELLIVAVDALDEASTMPDMREMARTLSQLAASPRARVAVATRSLAVGGRFGPDGLLRAFGIASARADGLVDLDTDEYFAVEDLRLYAGALLSGGSSEHRYPADGAWTSYRQDQALCDRLAAAVADRAGRNYLVAAVSAVSLASRGSVVDPAATGFDPAGIPSGIGEALAKYFDGLPEDQRPRTRALLIALAYARGQGLPDQTWLAFANALGPGATPADLDRLRTSGAADYLLQAVADPGGAVTRLFHQALVDELLSDRSQPSDEAAFLTTLLPTERATTPDRGPYALTYAADHAAAAGQLQRALLDPRLLGHADLSHLLAVAQTHPDHATRPITAVLRLSAARAQPLPAPRRMALLTLTAAHLGLTTLHRHLSAACSDLYTATWAHTLGTPHLDLTGHTQVVWAMAVAAVGGRLLVVSGSADGSVRRWDASTGEPVGQPITGHEAVPDRTAGGGRMQKHVWTVAAGRAGDRDVIVSGGADGTVRIWDAIDGDPIAGPLISSADADERPPVKAVTIGQVDGRDVIIAGGVADNTVRIWDAVTGQPIGQPLTGHTSAVGCVALGKAAGGWIVVSAAGKEIRVWNALTGQQITEAIVAHREWVHGLAVGRIGERTVIVSCGWHDLTVRIWDATTGQPVSHIDTDHDTHVNSVAIGQIAGRDVILSQGLREIHVWDASTLNPVGQPLTNAEGMSGVALGHIDGRDIVATSIGERVLLLEPAASDPRENPLLGFRFRVNRVAFGRSATRDVIVSGGSEPPFVRVWDARTGGYIGGLPGHTAHITALAVGQAAGRPAFATGSLDRTVRIWNVETGQPVGQTLAGHHNAVTAVAIGKANGRDTVISSATGPPPGTTSDVLVWDLLTGRSLGRLTGHDLPVTDLATGRLGNRDILASASNDCTVVIWDMATGWPINHLVHPWPVQVVALDRVNGRDVLVSVCLSTDYSNRTQLVIWDAATGRQIRSLPGPVGDRISLTTGRLHDSLVIACGNGSLVGVWGFDGRLLSLIDCLGETRSVSLSVDGRLCTTTLNAICLFTPARSPSPS